MTLSGLDFGAKREGTRWHLSSSDTLLGWVRSIKPRAASIANLECTFLLSFFHLSTVRDQDCWSFHVSVTPARAPILVMDNFHYPLSAEQLQSFQENGYLLVRGFFDPQESKVLQQWSQEVHDLPPDPGSAMDAIRGGGWPG